MTGPADSLRAQLDEDERVAREGGDWHHHLCGINASLFHETFTPARMLREVKAKRRILDAFTAIDDRDGCVTIGDWTSCSDRCATDVLREVVKILAGEGESADG